jgi:predicted  nucleic acid-binding Zn-ribbon protein
VQASSPSKPKALENDLNSLMKSSDFKIKRIDQDLQRIKNKREELLSHINSRSKNFSPIKA